MCFVVAQVVKTMCIIMKSLNLQSRNTREKVITISRIKAVGEKGNESRSTEVEFPAWMFLFCPSVVPATFHVAQCLCFSFLFLILFGLHLFERH